MQQPVTVLVRQPAHQCGFLWRHLFGIDEAPVPFLQRQCVALGERGCTGPAPREPLELRVIIDLYFGGRRRGHEVHGMHCGDVGRQGHAGFALFNLDQLLAVDASALRRLSLRQAQPFARGTYGVARRRCVRSVEARRFRWSCLAYRDTICP